MPYCRQCATDHDRQEGLMITAYLKVIRDSFWFRPALYNLVAVLLAIAAVLLDLRLSEETRILGVASMSLERTTELVATLAGAILTMTTITFSAILIVLTTYSSQFSPRVLQNFVANRATQHVLALFSSGFTYCVLVLLLVSEREAYKLLATPGVAIVWSLAGIAAFIFLLTHTTSWLQVNNLIGFIAAETEATMRHMLGRKVNDRRCPVEAEDSRWCQAGLEISACKSGYVVMVGLEGLLKKAEQDGVIVRTEVAVGAFVAEGMPLMSLIGIGSHKPDYEAYRELIQLDIEPRPWEDIGFGLRKMAEIALRAISPSINDPYTAATAVQYLGSILIKLAARSPQNPGLANQHGTLRVLIREPDFEEYLLRAFQELRRYGSEDITTLAAILEALGWIARLSGHQWHDLLWGFGADTYRLAEESNDWLPSEERRLTVPLRRLAATTGRQTDVQTLLEKKGALER
ncbi:MAG: hypothetical protein CL583_05025 [Alteromonadaceae bacterium]|nr:hypothetical protein [Alteromonadaceae bacterium]